MGCSCGNERRGGTVLFMSYEDGCQGSAFASTCEPP
ncbi:hypothetical protein IW248_003304 [Micromonospora ureilytica]|uniref:Uncharacterized protein n=1 Tax=Micromonospora ureilytica TaxID=709868 RepID=A0ABS0JIX6_9ACTN|nr:hypothetical protein [Micromonospora ureilytica]